MDIMEDLPIEILVKIFDFLSIDNLKSSTLTCKRWRDTIYRWIFPKRALLSIPRYHPSTQEPIPLAPIVMLHANSRVVKRHVKMELGNQFPEELTVFFQKCGPLLKTLIIEMKIINDSSTSILQYLNNMEHLDIYSSTIITSGSEFSHLSNVFQSLPNLLKLRLTTLNKLPRHDKYQIIESLSSNCHFLKSLVFEVNETILDGSDFGFYKFDFPYLKELHLKYIHFITEEEVELLVEKCPLIENLHVNNSTLSDNILKIIVNGLNKLNELLLSNVKNITDVSLSVIVGSSLNLKVLRVTDCVNITMGKNAALPFLNQIKSLSSLTYHHYQDYHYIYYF